MTILPISPVPRLCLYFFFIFLQFNPFRLSFFFWLSFFFFPCTLEFDGDGLFLLHLFRTLLSFYHVCFSFHPSSRVICVRTPPAGLFFGHRHLKCSPGFYFTPLSFRPVFMLSDQYPCVSVLCLFTLPLCLCPLWMSQDMYLLFQLPSQVPIAPIDFLPFFPPPYSPFFPFPSLVRFPLVKLPLVSPRRIFYLSAFFLFPYLRLLPPPSPV